MCHRQLSAFPFLPCSSEYSIDRTRVTSVPGSDRFRHRMPMKGVYMGVFDVLFVILIVILFIKARNQKSDLDDFQRKTFKQIGDLTDQLKRIPSATPIPPSLSKSITTPVGRKTTRPAAEQKTPPEPKVPPSPVPKPASSATLHPAGQFLNGLVEFFIGPFANLWSYVLKVYRYYKERDKLPVFFLT